MSATVQHYSSIPAMKAALNSADSKFFSRGAMRASLGVGVTGGADSQHGERRAPRPNRPISIRWAARDE